ncbi:nucleosome assembly protein 1-like 1-A [Microplitis demolitor]|uniref:nucleosome assembly protein 1-like 1-A n=1 Tax=Microplitis demolitor TaxID=69319 RepID=UPI0006D4D5F8|nr:nucleosome assembly protein 1-like 1-A [Microplitis demolitor]
MAFYKLQRRLRALKQLQFEYFEYERQLNDEFDALESKYHKMRDKLFSKRGSIIAGDYEPDDEECDWVNHEEDICNQLMISLKIDEESDLTGIPDFWLTVFKNAKILEGMVHSYDEPVLKYLYDVRIEYFKSPDPPGFMFEFYFNKNEYFKNSVLTKEYYTKNEVNKNNLADYGGKEIYKSVGCDIIWKLGKNVTVRRIKLKQGGMEKVRVYSFFNFFKPPVIPEGTDYADIDEKTKKILRLDFKDGKIFKDDIIPRAVLHFTNEVKDIVNDDDIDFDESDTDDIDPENTV